METLQVLIVDDERGIRVSVERVLRKYTVEVPELEREVNFEITQAESGEEALEIIAANPPHILLLDNKLPGISGMDVMEKLRPMKLDMQIIVITAYASIETAVYATKQGAFDLLPKPFTPTELRNAVRLAADYLMVSLEARRLAEEQRKVRFQFISVLSHELKAPINAIEGYLKILDTPGMLENEPASKGMIHRCLVRTEYMRKMIFDLLDMTRIESGERARNIETCDFLKLIYDAIDTVRPEADARGIGITLHDEAPVSLEADISELNIILNNLLTNAVKYNRDQGKVDIHLRNEDGQITLSVTDTGIGMTEEESARLFHDFVRIRNTKTENILGSGLGLSTVKKLTHLYQGDITLESEPDVGSTFTVMLKDTVKAGE